MVVIAGVIVVISAVSLYEFYSEKDWAQVTSQSRNKVVFEKRNQRYGAFEIRQNYDRKMMFILLGFTLSIASLYGGYRYFQEPIHQIIEKVAPDYIDYSTILNFNTPAEEPPVTKKVDEIQPKALKVDAFTPPTIVDVKTKNEINVDLGKNPISTIATVGPTGTGETKPTVTSTPAVIPPALPKSPTRDPDSRAKFPGGDTEKIKFLEKNINFPESGLDGEGGKCYLEFIVDENGVVSSVEILKGIRGCSDCNKEAERVVRKMPKWQPAILNGEKVASYYTMVINFEVEH